MLRRDFLRKSSIALVGGLIVGDAALELLDRLTHRKVFALGAMPDVVDISLGGVTSGTFSVIVRKADGSAIRRMRFNGLEADRIEDYGNGFVRGAIYLGPGKMRPVDGRLLQIRWKGGYPVHAQIEEGSWPSSPIVTFDKPVTRQPDRISYNWTTGEMTHTPLRRAEFPPRPGVLIESAATNFLTHSGDPRRRV